MEYDIQQNTWTVSDAISPADFSGGASRGRRDGRRCINSNKHVLKIDLKRSANVSSIAVFLVSV
jgi:hypothetical protein